VVVLGALAAFFFAFRQVKPRPLDSTVTIRSDRSVGAGDHVFRVELARTIIEHSRGLSGRERLGEDEGMYFIFDSPTVQGFWMKDMLFPIDIIWISGERVVGFKENAQPEPGRSIFTLPVYNSPGPVDRVLEVNAGTVAKYGIEVGDAVAHIDNQ
jgi:hypothetical protein